MDEVSSGMLVKQKREHIVIMDIAINSASTKDYSFMGFAQYSSIAIECTKEIFDSPFQVTLFYLLGSNGYVLELKLIPAPYD
ncbi:hypothetical protein TNCT_673801 [Trichonephila clavata]|uniref:Uncharacterized protein n=1 Tax=Trichonephila clavata TaxID=2740835 RepID=A0A8X6F3W1_TRICU|nr:hypothetical protein TNCT_673801 [Trichonephila clavata]